MQYRLSYKDQSWKTKTSAPSWACWAFQKIELEELWGIQSIPNQVCFMDCKIEKSSTRNLLQDPQYLKTFDPKLRCAINMVKLKPVSAIGEISHPGDKRKGPCYRSNPVSGKKWLSFFRMITNPPISQFWNKNTG